MTKSSIEYFLEFRSCDRFIYRISDLYSQKQDVSPDLLSRLDHCHLYILCTRPRVSIVPGTIHSSAEAVRMDLEYMYRGNRYKVLLDVPRGMFSEDEQVFEVAPYPHRELISRNEKGEVVATTLIANYVHLIPDIEGAAADLEVRYIGKGLSHSAQDRLRHHPTLQKILAEINSKEPEMEVFALIYSFEKHVHGAVIVNSETRRDINEKDRVKKMMAYRPSIGEQVALIEASCISYFRPQFNTQYVKFPNRKHEILTPVFNADFAAISVQLDNTNLGGQRIFSQAVKTAVKHDVLIDLRKLDGLPSLLHT